MHLKGNFDYNGQKTFRIKYKIDKIDNITKIQNVRYHILYFTIG
jgi:hypothetical protein